MNNLCINKKFIMDVNDLQKRIEKYVSENKDSLINAIGEKKIL